MDIFNKKFLLYHHLQDIHSLFQRDTTYTYWQKVYDSSFRFSRHNSEISKFQGRHKSNTPNLSTNYPFISIPKNIKYFNFFLSCTFVIAFKLFHASNLSSMIKSLLAFTKYKWFISLIYFINFFFFIFYFLFLIFNFV